MITVFAAEGAATATTPSAGGGIGATIAWIVVMIAVFYFLILRPQKKREKQTRMMLNEMRAGDEVITIGGIMGNIVTVKEDRVIIETGANKTKLTFEKGAIKSVLTVHEDEEEYEEDDETEE